jgi:hypothetical protein
MPKRCWSYAPEKIAVPVGEGRAMIEGLQQGLKEDDLTDSISKLCEWFNVPHRTVYYRPHKAPSRLNPAFVEPIKTMIEEESSFGYRTVASLLYFNKNTVQRIFQLKGWQVRKHPVCFFRPRIEALPSVATRPDERWATDLCRVWGGQDGWLTLALVIDCIPGNCWVGISVGATRPAPQALRWNRLSSLDLALSERSPVCLSCGQTMAWSSPAGIIRAWLGAMG